MTETKPPRVLWWLPGAKEVVAFMLGVFILVYETVFATHVEVTLVAAAVALMGVLGSGVAQRVLAKLIEE